MNDIQKTCARIEEILADDTAYDATKWTLENPWNGHCAVSALLIQDRHGGSIVKAKVAGASHYWNLIDGRHVDPSFHQYPVGTEKPKKYEVVKDRQLRWSIRHRYKLLSERF